MQPFTDYAVVCEINGRTYSHLITIYNVWDNVDARIKSRMAFIHGTQAARVTIIDKKALC